MYYREKQDTLPDKNGDYLWRPEFVRTGDVVDSRELAKMISTATTLTVAEIAAVLLILPEFMNHQLKRGDTVKLDGLGTFILYGRSRSKGVKTKEEVKPNQFSTIVCKFTPEYTVNPQGTRSSELLNGIELSHINKIAQKANVYTGDNNTGNNNPGGTDPGDDDDWQDPDA